MKRNITYRVLGAALLTITAGAALGALPSAYAQNADRSPIVNQLDQGATGNDVLRVQALLALNPTIYPAGLVTGYYGPLTAQAVTQFQIGYGIAPVGRVGPLTRAKMNSLIASGLAPDVNAHPIGNVSVAVTETTATITWSTAELTRGKVNYDVAPVTLLETSAALAEPVISGTAVSESGYVQSHSVTLSGLVSGRTYSYAIQSVDLTGNVSVMLPKNFTTK